MKKKTGCAVAALLVLLAVSGCATDRVQIRPVPSELADKNPSKRVCIVENPRVAVSDFLAAYRAALEARGYAVTVVQKTPSASACPLTTRYTAFQNGLTQLEVFWEGRPVGSAAHSAAAYSSAAINNMVQGLFP